MMVVATSSSIKRFWHAGEARASNIRIRIQPVKITSQPSKRIEVLLQLGVARR
jgi:hypothetical protein